MVMAPLKKWIADNDQRIHVSRAVDPISDKSSATCGAVDRTIYATSAIASGDVLVELHDGAFLNGTIWLRGVEAAMPSERASELKAEMAKLQPSGTVLAVLGLLAEKALGERSAFHGYIQQLPTSLPLPLTWSSESKALLKNTAAHPIVDDDLVDSIFARFAVPLTTKFPELCGVSSGVTLETFRWAYSIISSRAFSIGDSLEPTLLPVIDMANHDAMNLSAVIRKDDKTGGYSLVAVRAINADEPVTISYGSFSNAQLLCRYSFVLSDVAESDSILLASSYVRMVYAQLTSGGSVEAALAQLEYLAKESATPSPLPTSSSTSSSALENSCSPSASKRRKLFAAQEPGATDVATDAGVFFALHGDATQEFGLADGLMSFVFANDLPMESLYDVLTVLLQHKDKEYSALLAQETNPTNGGDQHEEAWRLTRALVTHERQVCRRILLGIMSLEEDSEDDDDDEASGEQDDEQEEDDEEEEEEDEE